MKKWTIKTIAYTMVFASAGCSGQFWGGAATGAVGSGAAYEINAKRQLDQLEADRKSGKITQEEYETRRDQIQKGSLIY